jgi:hypothetical protein
MMSGAPSFPATRSWAFLLLSQDGASTRLLARRRGGRPTVFDRVMAPGYVFMDKGCFEVSGSASNHRSRARAIQADDPVAQAARFVRRFSFATNGEQ